MANFPTSKTSQPLAGCPRAAGFTLIEVMIVVVILGILSSLAFPAYTDYIRRGRVTDAVAQLAEFNLRMEQASQDNGNYGVETCAVPVPAQTSYFKTTCELGENGQSYVATATGQAAMAGHTYTIDDAGTKQTTAFIRPVQLPASCWLLSEGDC